MLALRTIGPTLSRAVIDGRACALSRIGKSASWVFYEVSTEDVHSWENIVAIEPGNTVIDAELSWVFRTEEEARDYAARNGRTRLVRISPSLKIAGRVNSGRVESEDRLESDLSPRQAAVQFLLNAVDASNDTPWADTALTAFDCDAKTYRLLSWVWTSGIVATALLRQEDETAVVGGTRLAEGLLRRLIRNGEHDGGLLARWDVSDQVPTGIVPWLAPNDAAFAVARALIPLYRLRRDQALLDAAIRTGEWVRRARSRTGAMPVGFMCDVGLWDDSWYYVDAGILAPLLSELYETTGDPAWLDELRGFCDDYLERMYVGAGLFRKTWRRGRLGKPVTSFSRGYAWALECLLSAAGSLGGPRYVDIIDDVSDVLLRTQQSDGSWSSCLLSPMSGACGKSTPAIGYLLLEVDRCLGRPRCRQAAWRALQWCLSAQAKRRGHPEFGGVTGWDAEGCIVTRRLVSSSFNYGAAYYLLLLDGFKR